MRQLQTLAWIVAIVVVQATQFSRGGGASRGCKWGSAVVVNPEVFAAPSHINGLVGNHGCGVDGLETAGQAKGAPRNDEDG